MTPNIWDLDLGGEGGAFRNIRISKDAHRFKKKLILWKFYIRKYLSQLTNPHIIVLLGALQKNQLRVTNNKTRFTNLAIDVVVHGDVGVRDVDLDVEVGDVLDPRVVAVPHQRLHRHNRVHWK